MSNEKNTGTILIYEHPNAYFFPDLPDPVYQPFGVPKRSLRYVIYRLMQILRLPFAHHFWGSWTEHIADARRVVIFDYGYQRGMERYVHSVNPGCKVYLFVWNKADARHTAWKQFSDRDSVYCTDPQDCERLHFHYNSMFYAIQYRKPWQDKNRRLFFIGRDKGRAARLLELEKILTRCGVSCDIRIVGDTRDEALRHLYTEHSLSYPEYLRELDGCDILLDISQDGQQALTMRVLEAVFLSKKLITGNEAVRSFEFYDENNIFVLPADVSRLSDRELLAFLDRPFVPYPQEVLQQYSYEAWLERFS